ncbi:YihY family inner membrane protein [Ralstonia solanacearum P673]|uniref:YihY family inner membrane protein n=1 Tax=Ralstonia solanacearum TaxID=305 RepID=UPI000446D0F6|nr:YihY family inner membrane protein [Ralstonia solanacearum]EUJ14975.1 membrane protein [Ralstonia solanacearum P673]MCL9849225.1 YihY family inner membrane protein [Ralstonia solanacearum]MCL9854813.1 YihY family inner membrane protein [Ralstonia solanacearum]MCL9860045.1 YihY family inner membrane protein [Ralstonia solanacearum]MCL9864503.1 YihY family inner membrane protein [Ralstonia solanacearum]
MLSDTRVLRQWNVPKLRALLRYALRRAGEDSLPQVAGSLTFTTVLSLVPILTVAFALFTAFPMFQSFRAAIESYLFSNLVPGNISRPILTYLNQFSHNAKGLTAAGLVGLVVTSVMTMLTVENALNAIWRVHQRRPLTQRVLVFWALVSFGPVLIGASLSVSSYLVSISAGYVAKLPYGLGVVVGMVPILLSAIAFAMLYVFVPNTLVAWRDAFLAGLVAAVAFEIAKRGFGYYVARFPTYTAVYGTFAALPIFLLWIYVSWLVTLLGATIAATLPIVRQGYWQRRTFPGSEFFDALGILLLLHRARDHAPRTLGESDIGRRLQLEADYVAGLLARLKTLHLVGKLQQERGQAHWALLCDAHTTTLRPLYERLVLNLPRLSRTAFARQLGDTRMLEAQLHNPALDCTLEAVFASGEPGVKAAVEAAAGSAAAAPLTTAARA